MGVEVMIYIYGAICFSMIIFNIVYGILMRRSEPRMNKKIKRLQKKIDVQIENICAGKPVDSKHLNYLEHKLILPQDQEFELYEYDVSPEEAEVAEKEEYSSVD